MEGSTSEMPVIRLCHQRMRLVVSSNLDEQGVDDQRHERLKVFVVHAERY
jgi:hypothetical protein